jgi:glucose-1-phosphate thymidylyltransferase
LLAAHNSQKYDVTLGLFPTLKPERFGMVAFDQHNHFLYTVDKPAQTDLTYMWGIGCWGPVFSDFMHTWLRKQPPVRGEIVLADIFQAAQHAGLRLGVVPYVNGEYVDIGSLDDLAGMLKRFTPQ